MTCQPAGPEIRALIVRNGVVVGGLSSSRPSAADAATAAAVSATSSATRRVWPSLEGAPSISSMARTCVGVANSTVAIPACRMATPVRAGRGEGSLLGHAEHITIEAEGVVEVVRLDDQTQLAGLDLFLHDLIVRPDINVRSNCIAVNVMSAPTKRLSFVWSTSHSAGAP